MEKIVIVSRETDSNQVLIQLLNELFPECEIYTISPDTDNSRTCTKDLDRLLVPHTKESATHKCETSVEHDHHHWSVTRGS